MSKLLRRLGHAGKAAKGGHDPPLPPLEAYQTSPLLSELPEECVVMVRKAGLLPFEAEQDFGVLLSCLYFELKHSPDLTAQVKALIRKHRRPTKTRSKEAGASVLLSSTPHDNCERAEACDHRAVMPRPTEGGVVLAQLDHGVTNQRTPPTLPTQKIDLEEKEKEKEKEEKWETQDEKGEREREKDEEERDATAPTKALRATKDGKKKRKKKKTKTKKAAKSNVQESSEGGQAGEEKGVVCNEVAAATHPCKQHEQEQREVRTPRTEGAASGSEGRGRSRGFSFSFFRPSSSPSLDYQTATELEDNKLAKKRFSASGLLRPSASLSGTAASSPLVHPAPLSPAEGRKTKKRNETTTKGHEGDKKQGHHNYQLQHNNGGLDCTDASSSGHPVREELFLLDNPATVFSSKQKIGRGGFGDVYTGKDKTSNQVVAIKILKKPFSEHGEQICNELEILRSCRHDSIVNYLRSYLFKDRVWMVMEYCDGGSLQSLIEGVDLNEGQIANVLRKVLSGLDYLHKQNRIHRDIKADNILLNINGAVKVADLGLCAELKDGDDFKAGMVGSRYWMAPEVIKRERYNCKADIWSLGAVAMEMAQQHPPYHGQPSLKVLFHLATKGAPPLKNLKKWSPEFQHFIAQCFTMDPEHRPSAEQLLEHPFIAKASPNSKLEQAISIVFLGDSLKMNGF